MPGEVETSATGIAFRKTDPATPVHRTSGRDDKMRVFLLRECKKKKNIGRKEAAELVKYHDEMLHSRYKYMTGSYRGDRKGRHMMIDSSVLGWEKTAQYMLQMIDLRFED